jgi:hypothetical protein
MRLQCGKNHSPFTDNSFNFLAKMFPYLFFKTIFEKKYKISSFSQFHCVESTLAHNKANRKLMNYLVIMVGAEEDGHEGQPDDAGGVHREPDVLGLVKIFYHE